MYLAWLFLPCISKSDDDDDDDDVTWCKFTFGFCRKRQTAKVRSSQVENFSK